MLYGFNISHFRNFGESPSLVGPLGKMNVFIGSNNSGKSNILRYVRDYLIPTLNIQRGTPPAISPINRSLFARDEPKFFQILIPIDEKLLRETFKFPHDPLNDKMVQFMRELPNVIDGDFWLISLPVDASNNRKVETSGFDLGALDQNFLQNIANTAGLARGSSADWLSNIFGRIISKYLINHDTKYVPAFRQVKTKLANFEVEYEKFSGSGHITDDLIKYSNPTFDKQENKKTFRKLVNFISDITQIEDIAIEIPHDLSTINVSANGVLRPLETLGSGVHELFMLAAEVVLNEGKIVLLEEPETHLHPEFQRKLMRFLSEEVESQFFITTHSPVIIDTPNAKVFGVSAVDNMGSVQQLLTNQSRRDACRELGYRASDLLQSNCIIWVEGPSDRIYLRYWLALVDPSLREGVEYSIMFYGGRLLSHLSARDEQVSDFIELLPINRAVALLIDSDLGSSSQELRSTKIRVRDEVIDVGGFAWVTEGREIENYVPFDIRERAIKEVHSSAQDLVGSRSKFGKPLDFSKIGGQRQTSGFDKLGIAKAAVRLEPGLDCLDLRRRIEELASFIRAQN